MTVLMEQPAISDPTLLRAEDCGLGDLLDPVLLRQNRERAAERIKKSIPRHFANAVVTDPAVRNWTLNLIRQAVHARPAMPTISTGRSLRILGPTGTGKSYQAYGALRAIGASGVACSWIYITAADLYASLQPRQNVDIEAEFNKYVRVPLLVLDDLGAVAHREYREDVNYRLINARYEHELPTLITSNLSPKDLAEMLGERVTSRLVGMSDQVALKGGDRRRGQVIG